MRSILLPTSYLPSLQVTPLPFLQIIFFPLSTSYLPFYKLSPLFTSYSPLYLLSSLSTSYFPSLWVIPYFYKLPPLSLQAIPSFYKLSPLSSNYLLSLHSYNNRRMLKGQNHKDKINITTLLYYMLFLREIHIT